METVTVRGPEQIQITLHGSGGQLDPNCDGTESRKILFQIGDEIMRRYYPAMF
jgi:hypothetical protein